MEFFGVWIVVDFEFGDFFVVVGCYCDECGGLDREFYY